MFKIRIVVAVPIAVSSNFRHISHITICLLFFFLQFLQRSCTRCSALGCFFFASKVDLLNNFQSVFDVYNFKWRENFLFFIVRIVSFWFGEWIPRSMCEQFLFHTLLSFDSLCLLILSCCLCFYRVRIWISMRMAGFFLCVPVFFSSSDLLLLLLCHFKFPFIGFEKEKKKRMNTSYVWRLYAMMCFNFYTIYTAMLDWFRLQFAFLWNFVCANIFLLDQFINLSVDRFEIENIIGIGEHALRNVYTQRSKWMKIE